MKGKEKEFVSWFSEKEHKYGARKKVVIDKWLYGEMKKNPYWKFNEYPISKEKIDGFLVFEERCFGDEESLELFKERVDSYVFNRVYLSSQKESFEYKYIYYFNLGVKEILFLELNIIGKKSNGDHIVELIPSSFYTNKGIEKYIGTLIKDGNHYHISAKNRFEIVTFYFLTNRGFESNKIVYGLSLELSCANLLPTAKKRVMTTHELTTEERQRLYLSLNETEYLVSNEIFDSTEMEKRKYFDNFYKKIKNLNNFVKQSQRTLREEIKDDAYLNIFYDTFDSFYNTLTRIKLNKRYGVSNKRRAYIKFLESIEQRENAICYVVNPIHDSYIYLFDENSQDLIQHNIELTKQGLKMELIFVVSKEYQLNDFIQKMVQRLISHNIVVRFALLDEIEELLVLDSYDFLCSNRDDIALYRATFAHKYLYNITLSKDKIRKLQSDYKKIKKISHPLEKFLLYQKRQDNEIINELEGTWHHYYYGSRRDSKNNLMIWKSELHIESSGEVKYMDGDRVVLKGVINTTFNKKHPFIYLTAIESKTLALITFDESDIYRKIFKAPLLDKQLSYMFHMVSFGFFSKEKLDNLVVKNILGEENKILLEEDDIQGRINEYYNNKNF
jgi:hypothetical protein